MNFQSKVRILSVVFGLFFVAVTLRLFHWQILAGESLAAEAESQHFYTLTVPAKRGEIVFSDNSPLVSNESAFLLYANLSKVTKSKSDISESLANALYTQIPLVATDGANITAEDKEKFFKNTKQELEDKINERLNIKTSIWVNLAHFVPRAVEEKIAKMKIEGLDFAEEDTRDYPESSMAAHLTGFVGANRVGEPKGYFGLEGEYDRELAGKPGVVRIEKDAFGRPIAIGSEERLDKKDGSKLVTGLDRSVQMFTEAALKKGISDWKAKSGSAVVMDPYTGQIVAFANFPSYDQKNFPYYESKLYKNPGVADLYEPGSIFKPLVMSAAINEDKVTPDTRCDKCDGPRYIGGYYIHTFNNQYHPNLTMTETLVNSDNTGMTFVGEKLGFDNLRAYVRNYGFGEKTGVDLEEEAVADLKKKEDFYEIDKATLTFGQGILVNAVQMVRAFSAIANGGYLATPHLVTKIETDDKTIPLSWPKGRKIIKESTAKTISEMMVKVCEESPTHFPRDRTVGLDGFRIACKSGTAQIAVAGEYKENTTTASVIGFFPADKPRYLVYVKLNQPEVRIWGSDTAGPVFFSIVRDLINYYGISPN